MVLDLRDRGIHKELFLFGTREPESVRIFMNELSPGMTVLDIGANIGYYVLIEAQILENEGTIYAVEPEPQNFENMKKNIEINSYDTYIKLYNLAISDKIGKAELEIANESNLHRLIPVEKLDGKYVIVDTITLDEFLMDKKVDYIRMDVEGGEILIINGMNNILNSSLPLKLFIEIHPRFIKEYGSDVEEMLEILSRAGFSLKYLVMDKPKVPLIPYIKGRGRLEKSITFNKALKDCLKDEEIRSFLIPTKGDILYEGYHVFLERGNKKGSVIMFCGLS